MKKTSSYRLSDEAKRLLALLAEADGINCTSMLEIAIREVAKKRGVYARIRVQTQGE